MNFSKSRIAGVISLLFCASETVMADPPTYTPGLNPGQPVPSGEMLRQQANPTLPVSPLSPADVMRAAALPGSQPEPGGLRAGSFLFYPDLSVSQLYDTNIYSTRTNETRDWVTVYSPTLAVRSDWARHSLNFWTGANVDRYHTFSSEDVSDHWFEGQGRYDISATTNVYAGGGISRNHEDRYNVDPSRTGLEPTVFWDTKSNVGAFHQFGKSSVRVGATWEHLQYDNVAAPGGGIIEMGDRNVVMSSVGGRLSYQVAPKYQMFAQLATDTRRYDMTGVGRDSSGYRAAAGLGLDLGGNNTAEAYFGHMQQNYDNVAYADVSKPYYGADAKFAISPTAYVTGYVDRTLEETTLPGASGYLDTIVGGRIDQDVNRNLAVNGRLEMTQSQFQGLDRQDNYLDAGFGAKYYVTREIYLAADYRMLLRQSNAATVVVNGVQDTFDFSRNQVFVSLGYTPGRRPRAAALSSDDSSGVLVASTDLGGLKIPASALPDYSGLYLGGLVSSTTLSSEIYSPRDGGSGTDEMDMAKQGGIDGAVFIGYGWMWHRWYYGVEFDAGTGNPSWYHQKDKADARTMSLEESRGYGPSLRLGYAVDGGLLYGSLGVVRSDFKTYETENQYASTGAAILDQGVNGVRYGVGVDIPASQRLFVRMAYAYTDYGSYHAPYQTGTPATTTDTFDNADSAFQLGLGWRLGGPDDRDRKPLPVVDATSVSGFYFGALAGADSLTTRMDALQNDSGGSGCANCFFTGDFGKTAGTWGLFTGYGFTLDRVYLGIDFDAQSSNASWLDNRSTSGGGGRDFGVQAQESYGAGVRLGYVLNNGSLLYARAGRVRTRFTTTYIKGNSTPTWVDRDDLVDGSRFGVGAEVPAYRNLFVRLEYDMTRYGDYGFTTTQSSADSPVFKNFESLFNMGLALRF